MHRCGNELIDNEMHRRASDRLRKVLGGEPTRWLLVSVADQCLVLVEGGRASRVYGVSTAAAGLNGREGSLGTPPGVHRIARRIGAGQELGTWFSSREPEGVWRPGEPAPRDDLILTRILTLQGCEEGLNRGPGCDSEGRFIYIHGTNHEDRIGEPVSQGCIRMSNTDVLNLFERVDEGDPVVIV